MQALLMGGQACVLYGAAEFSRDTDTNRLEAALHDEETAERAADRAYWDPLKRELERLRRDERS